MSEQTEQPNKALEASTQTPAGNRPPPGFGARTDGQVGMSLGMAPPGLGNRQNADTDAPASLQGDMSSAHFEQRVVEGAPPASKPKEHPFKKQMREAAEAYAAQKAETRETVEAELVEDDANDNGADQPEPVDAEVVAISS
jgi:hypothetical protein